MRHPSHLAAGWTQELRQAGGESYIHVTPPPDFDLPGGDVAAKQQAQQQKQNKQAQQAQQAQEQKPPQEQSVPAPAQSLVPKEVQEKIDRGEPPDAKHHWLFGNSCPDCKYYPKEVTEAVDAHEQQHKKDTDTLSGFAKRFTEEGRAELEARGFKAELAVVERNIKNLTFTGPLSPTQQKTLNILKNMRDQAQAVIANPKVYVTAPR